METVTYQRGPTRSSRCCRRGSRCPNSRPELQVTDATALGPARPGSAGGGGDPDPGVGRQAAQPSRFTPNVRVGAPAGPVSSPQFRRRGRVWGGWERPPDLLPKLGGKWEPIASLFRKLPELGAPRDPSLTLISKSPNWVFPGTPQTFIFKLPELELLGTSSYFFPPKSLNWGRPGTPLSLSLNFLKPSQILTSNSQNWGLLGTLLLFCSPNL